MSDIDYIRKLLKKFEENVNNMEGVEYLRSALAEMVAVLEEANNERERTFVKNAVHKYRNLVIEEARRVCNIGTPSFDELNLIVGHMVTFKTNGFNDDSDFKDTLGKTIVKYIEAFFREIHGKGLDDTNKAEIYKNMTKDEENVGNCQNILSSIKS